jgi:hypothetical protein
MKLDMFRMSPDEGVTIDAKKFRFQGTELEALPYHSEDGWTTVAKYDRNPKSDRDWVRWSDHESYTDLTFYDGPASGLFHVVRLEKRR